MPKPGIKQAADFPGIFEADHFRSIRSNPAVTNWLFAHILSARDAQLRGDFHRAVQLSTFIGTDDAIFVARNTRLEPQASLPVEVVRNGAPSRVFKLAQRLFGRNGIAIEERVIRDMHWDLVEHGVAFGRVSWTLDAGGIYLEPCLTYWPLHAVYFHETHQHYIARTEAFGEVVITPNDGAWVMFSKSKSYPFRKDACLIPAALTWLYRSGSKKDWFNSSASHGGSKIVGTLPENMSIQDENGDLTPEARDFKDMIDGLAEGDTYSGVKPFGSEVEFIHDGSTAWQIWDTLALTNERSAARIYLGTDGILGATGGAPGVDVTALFGVKTTRVQRDLTAIEDGIFEGVIKPWMAVNFGSTEYTPRRTYQLPDTDAATRIQYHESKYVSFGKSMTSLRDAGIDITQDVLAELLRTFDLPVTFALKKEVLANTSLVLAATDVPSIVTINEGRASIGLPPLVGGEQRIAEYVQDLLAQVETPSQVRPDEQLTLPFVASGTELSTAIENLSKANEHIGRMNQALLEDIRERRMLGIRTTQEDVDLLAKSYGIPTIQLEESHAIQ